MKDEFKITLEILIKEKQNILKEIQNNQNTEERIKLIENLTYLDDKIKSYNEYITNIKNSK